MMRLVSVVAILATRHAPVCMVLCFFTTAALGPKLRGDFLAIGLVLLYVGAMPCSVFSRRQVAD
jgi:NADH:ubiquinone oxidoreductase subunit 6 (subunit J)